MTLAQAQESLFLALDSFMSAKSPKERWKYWGAIVNAFEAWKALR